MGLRAVAPGAYWTGRWSATRAASSWSDEESHKSAFDDFLREAIETTAVEDGQTP